jgi:UDP-N-acetylglucosamine:LPS N-acetylglucosamine transferase
MSQAELTAPDRPLAGILAALTRADAQTMARAAHAVGKRDAADNVAAACLELAGVRPDVAEAARRSAERG